MQHADKRRDADTGTDEHDGPAGACEHEVAGRRAGARAGRSRAIAVKR
jgi:hypothetical protein